MVGDVVVAEGEQLRGATLSLGEATHDAPIHLCAQRRRAPCTGAGEGEQRNGGEDAGFGSELRVEGMGSWEGLLPVAYGGD